MAFCGTGGVTRAFYGTGRVSSAFCATRAGPIASRWTSAHRLRSSDFVNVTLSHRLHSPTSLPIVPAGTIYAFDKVPKKLPDWWDDEDDDDEDDEQSDKNPLTATRDPSIFINKRFDAGGDGNGNGGNGSGGNGGYGGGGHSDDQNDHKDDDDQTQKGFFAALLLWYSSALVKHPIPTKAITTSLMALVGDVLAQRIAHGKSPEPFKLDNRRAFAISFWGLIFMGPALHTWFGFLNRTIVGSRFVVVRKVAIDQIMFAPFFISTFMFGTAALEGKSMQSMVQTWKDKFRHTMLINWLIWPLVQTINFGIVPAQYQTVFSNIVALGWNTVLTYITHDVPDEDELAGEAVKQE